MFKTLSAETVLQRKTQEKLIALGAMNTPDTILRIAPKAIVFVEHVTCFASAKEEAN